MKKILWFFAALLFATLANAQAEGGVVTTKKLKVVFHITSSDTLVQKGLARQLGNFLVAAPNAKIEVVCNSDGITFLEIARTKQADKIRELKAKGIDFVACENTMRSHKLKREDLVADCRTVPSGVVEVALKEDKKWGYIKSGL